MGRQGASIEGRACGWFLDFYQNKKLKKIHLVLFCKTKTFIFAHVKQKTKTARISVRWQWILSGLLGTLAALGLLLLGSSSLRHSMGAAVGQLWAYTWAHASTDFYLFLLAGFAAQMVDGALGMAYGVTATTTLLSVGVPPAAASASVHSSEIFTSGVSGLMHLRFRNVNTRLFRKLLVPGMLGAILGAFFISELEALFQYVKGFVAIYTLLLGVLIIRKAVRKKRKTKKFKRVRPLAFVGGFLDSVGGGGWGPIVTTTLIAGGRAPRYTIGSVNLAEFFVAAASSVAFVTLIGLTQLQIIAGLILGGLIAAPLAAHLSQRLPIRTMMITVGCVVILVSLRLILLAFL
jgi:uncharacterized membrane protein YfcA